LIYWTWVELLENLSHRFLGNFATQQFAACPTAQQGIMVFNWHTPASEFLFCKLYRQGLIPLVLPASVLDQVLKHTLNVIRQTQILQAEEFLNSCNVFASIGYTRWRGKAIVDIAPISNVEETDQVSSHSIDYP
jgi:hypothetical protein